MKKKRLKPVTDPWLRAQLTMRAEMHRRSAVEDRRVAENFKVSAGVYGANSAAGSCAQQAQEKFQHAAFADLLADLCEHALAVGGA